MNKYTPLYKPTNATLYMTKVCNFFCEGCSRQTVGVNVFDDLNVEVVKKALEQYPSLFGFTIAGLGEPTLNGNFVSVLDFLKENGKYVGVITNGSNIKPFKQLKQQPDYISVSLYGYNKEQYNDYVKLDAFDQVMKNFQELKQLNTSVGLSYFVCKENIHHLERVVEMADEIGADFLNVTNYLVYDVSNQEELSKIIYSDDHEYIRDIEAILAKSKIIKAKPIYLDREYSFHCPSYRNVININGDGTIGGCQRQFQPAAEYGNLFSDENPYNSGKMAELQAMINNAEYPHGDNCKYCFGKMYPQQNDILNIGIYILFYEKVDQTIECIKSYLPFSLPIYILNNASSAETRQQLVDFITPHKNVTLFDSDKNLGVGVGRNFMIENTDHEWMFFVDNDITIDTYDFLNRITQQIKANPTIEVFMPLLFNLHDDTYLKPPRMLVENGVARIERANNEFTNMFPGGASVIHRSLFTRLGLYDDAMFVGLEDFEMALRAIEMGEEIRSLHVDSILLIHDHRTAENFHDKKAILERYNFEKLDKSYYRIVDKYPHIEFKLEFRPWVVDQLGQMLGTAVDLKLLNSEYRFGSSGFNQFPVLETIKYKNTFVHECVMKGKKSLILSFHELDSSIPETVNIFARSKDKSTELVDFENYTQLEMLFQEYLNSDEKLSVYIYSLFEFIQDPRPILKYLRTLTHQNQSVSIYYCGDDQLNELVYKNNKSYFYWKPETLKQLLVSSGFMVKQAGHLQDDENRYGWELESSPEQYEVFLRSSFLPANNKYMVVTQEHGAAKITGGIGSYVQELEKLFGEDLSVLMVAAPALYPDKSVSMQLRHMVPSIFYNEEDCGYERAHLLVKECIDIALFLYDNLTVIEVQDVNGKAYQALQASNAGLYPNGVTFQTLCHASRLSLEYLFENWINYKDAELIEEKYVIEKADNVIFPTKYLVNFYKENGYMIDDDKIEYCRLPFSYNSQLVLDETFGTVDTLIFFGKRLEYKGYGLFAKTIRLLMEHPIFLQNIKEIVLLGPKSEEMGEYNDFFDSLKLSGIDVKEHSLERKEALKLVQSYAHRAICYTPYLADNHPNTVLEVVDSMSLLLASNSGGIPELIPSEFHSKVLFDLTEYSMANLTLHWLQESSEKRHQFVHELKSIMMEEQIKINAQTKARFEARGQKEIVQTLDVQNKQVQVIFQAANHDEITYILKMLYAQDKAPASIVCLYQGMDVEKIIPLFPDIKIVVAQTSLQSLLMDDSIVMFFTPKMKVTTSYIRKLSSVLMSTKADGVIFNTIEDGGKIKNAFLGDGVFYFPVKNIVGHPYGAYFVNSIKTLEFLDRESIWDSWAFITNFVSNKKKLKIYPHFEIELDQRVVINSFKDEMKIAKSIKSLSYFEMLRANASLYQLVEMEKKYIDLSIKQKIIETK